MKLSEKLVKASDSLSVNIYDNGFMVEVSGRNKDDDYTTAKIKCDNLEEVMVVITDAANMPRD